MNPTSSHSTSTTPLLLLTCIIIFSFPSSAETYNNWANTHFTVPEIAAGIASPLCDHDDDLCPNIVEYFSDTLPKDGDSATTKTFSTEEIPGKVTVRFPAALDRTDVEHVVLVSNDLINWIEDAVFICHEGDLMYHLNGYQFVKIGVRPKPGVFIDTDGDGLLDFFEESLIILDPNDAFESLLDILPNDDFDNDGTDNIDEEANNAGGVSYGKPGLLAFDTVSCAIDELPPVDPPILLVHTVLQ